MALDIRPALRIANGFQGKENARVQEDYQNGKKPAAAHFL